MNQKRYTRACRAALEGFQRDSKIKIDGIWDEETENAMIKEFSDRNLSDIKIKELIAGTTTTPDAPKVDAIKEAADTVTTESEAEVEVTEQEEELEDEEDVEQVDDPEDPPDMVDASPPRRKKKRKKRTTRS